MAAGRVEISGLGVAIAAAGAFLVYVGIRDVPVLQGLREITSGHLPEGKTGSAEATAVTAARARLDASARPSGGPTTAPAAASHGGLAAAALRYRGVPYRWGGESPTGLDCSGLVQLAFRDIGIKAPRTTYTQQPWSALRTIPADQARRDDLVFWPGHVAIMIGPGQVVHAPRPGTVVRVESVATAGPRGTRPTYKRYVGRQVVSV